MAFIRGLSSNNGVLGNGCVIHCINTFLYYRSAFRRCALLSWSCWSSGFIHVNAPKHTNIDKTLVVFDVTTLGYLQEMILAQWKSGFCTAVCVNIWKRVRIQKRVFVVEMTFKFGR